MAVYSLIFCLSLFVGVTLGQSEDECGGCDVRSCPEATGCYAGLVQDRCGCCNVCGRAEGEPCDLTSETDRHGDCGENLDCKPTGEVGEEGVCVCHEPDMVCDSNNVTHGNLCQLMEKNFRSENGTALKMVSWGPCESAPIIVSAPEDSHEPYGSNLVLDCETKGFPVPSIRWEVVKEDGSVVQLPSDDEFVAVQVRGGPERLMTTGWVQIIDLRPFDAGTYVCVASNSHGEARAKASVGVYKPAADAEQEQ